MPRAALGRFARTRCSMRRSAASRPPRNIVLAVDASAFDRSAARQVGRSLARLFGLDAPSVQPVYVLTPDAAPLPFRWFDDAAPRLKEEAEDSLRDALGASSFPFTDPEVLVEHRGSPRGVVESLNEYARRARAALIAVPTVREARLRRFLLGSFSEAMLFDSELPMLTINSDDRPAVEGRRRCLAAIDAFSAKHAGFADRVVDFAMIYDFDVVFVHAMPPGPGRSAWADAPTLVDSRALGSSDLGDEHKRALDLVGWIVRRAAARRCRATGRIIVSALPVPKAVMHAATAEGASLVAVASQSTPLRSLVSRSTARDIIRASAIPVWTLPNQALAAGSTASSQDRRSRALPIRRARRDFRPSFS
jgi:nucleotide-binding universal stress UspA family protein